MAGAVLITPVGDSAVAIRVRDRPDERAHGLVRAVCARVHERPPPGFIETVPGYTSVTVHYDPGPAGAAGVAPYECVLSALQAALIGLEEVRLPPERNIEIPVCYGGEFGPDLQHVADHAGLEPDEVVRVHSSGDYLVRMQGFLPGFAYLSGLDERIATPRRSTPRTEVPASSVAIGGSQTGIYPIACPGGWHLIGRTPVRLFDPTAPAPFLLRAGDRVRFRAIPAAEYRAASVRP